MQEGFYQPIWQSPLNAFLQKSKDEGGPETKTKDIFARSQKTGRGQS
jgi:hypothetical protein